MLPPIVMADPDVPDLPWCGLDLITPLDAIRYIATGSFGHQTGVPFGPWWNCSREDLYARDAQIEAREEVATEMLVAAIGQGRVRCAYVFRKSLDEPWRRQQESKEVFLLIDPAQFTGVIEHDWTEEGFEITFYGDGFDNGRTLRGFLLVWDEVAALRQNDDRPDSGTSAAPDAPWEGEDIEPELHRRPTPMRSGLGMHAKGRRGKPPGRKVIAHGEPIALLTLSLLAMPDDEFARVTGPSAAAELGPIYAGCIGEVPNPDSLEKLAEGVLRAVRKRRNGETATD